MSTSIVSCYYRLNESKHSIGEYICWITQFLVNVDTPIIMFSDGDDYNFLCEIRKQANLSDKFFPIRKPLADLEFSTPEWIHTWTNHVEKSNFKHLHNQELYRIWANKSFFVKEAIELNPFKSENFVWCDAGSWRESCVASHFGKGWPSTNALKPGCLLLLTMEDLNPFLQKLNDINIQTLDDVVTRVRTDNICTFSGSILAGDKAAWQKWTPIYQSVLECFIKHNLFAGDDQSVIASSVFWLCKTDPGAVPTIYMAPPENGFIVKNGVRMGDRWFALQIFLSQEFKNRLL